MTKPSYLLRITRANQPPTETEHDQANLSIGREAGDIVLRDPGASSKHAELRFADGELRVRDVGSTNGTWVGTRRVADEPMAPGTVYRIGGSTIELVAVRGVVAPAGTLVMPVPRGPVGTERQLGTAVQPRPDAGGSPFARMDVEQKRRLLVGAGIVLAMIVLGVVFGRGSRDDGGNTGDPGGAGSGLNAVGKLTTMREANVKAVWFKGPVGPQASGGTSPTNVRISPNDKGRASVGTTEQFAGGAGNQWKTAAWLAAFSSSRLTGRNLTDHEFLVGTGGHIDGPSAGMLMTATMLALLRGKTPRADTTMTGTINPDGSAGPVAGNDQ